MACETASRITNITLGQEIYLHEYALEWKVCVLTAVRK